MEEYEGEQKLLVLGLCLAELELVLGHQAVKPFHVCLQTFRRFRGHLYTGLEDRYGELGSRTGAKPQPAIGRKPFHYRFARRRQPRSNLNCGWRVLLAPNISTILSNFGIQLRDKWQFARNTQAPSFAPTSIILQSKYFISDRD